MADSALLGRLELYAACTGTAGLAGLVCYNALANSAGYVTCTACGTLVKSKCNFDFKFKNPPRFKLNFWI